MVSGLRPPAGPLHFFLELMGAYTYACAQVSLHDFIDGWHAPRIQFLLMIGKGGV
jgi:hypothetical protein